MGPILTFSLPLDKHTHTRTRTLTLSHSLPSDAHKLNLTLTHSCYHAWLSHDICHAWLSPTDGMSFSQFGNRQARIFFQAFVLMKHDFVLKDTNKQ